MKRLLTSALVILWLLLYPALFVGGAFLSRFNPYYFAALMILCNSVNCVLASANRQSPYERPMMYNSETLLSGLYVVGNCMWVALLVCLFIDWKIALLGLVASLLCSGFITFLASWLVVAPMYFLLSALLAFAKRIS